MTHAHYVLTVLLLTSQLAIAQAGLTTADIPEGVLDKIHFRSIGPTKQGGRIMDFGVPDQTKQPFTFYAAASTGGLWKTTDNGLTWEPIFDDVDINAIGDVAVAHSPQCFMGGDGQRFVLGRRPIQIDRRRRVVDAHGA